MTTRCQCGTVIHHKTKDPLENIKTDIFSYKTEIILIAIYKARHQSNYFCFMDLIWVLWINEMVMRSGPSWECLGEKHPSVDQLLSWSRGGISLALRSCVCLCCRVGPAATRETTVTNMLCPWGVFSFLRIKYLSNITLLLQFYKEGGKLIMIGLKLHSPTPRILGFFWLDKLVSTGWQ